jgi:hypothetical protein
MNKLLLDDLQRRSVYPSVTILVTTTPDVRLSAGERASVAAYIDDADRRLCDDVEDDVRADVIARLRALLEECQEEVSSQALALCASPDHATVVKLGRPVASRLIIDDTFATRDLVADLNRSALFRVVTLSGQRARLLVGDRNRLVEAVDETLPMERGEEDASSWDRRVSRALRDLQVDEPMPTVLGGVSRSVRAALDSSPAIAIGTVRGNQDRTSWTDLHNAAWPVVADWLRSDRADALRRLDQARSRRRFAGGIDEAWPLALEGRIELIVVEAGFSLAVRIGPSAELIRAEDIEAPDVVDDIVDDTIEAVLRSGGRAVIVDDGTLDQEGGVAAVVRY